MGVKKRTRTTEITVERSEVLVVRRSRFSVYAWCSRCGARVQMLTPEEAARAADVSTRTIYSRVENGQIHFTEMAEGMFVCLNSLL